MPEHLKQFEFQKGHSGNPGGRYKLPPDLKRARKYNNVEVERTVHQLLESPVYRLEGLKDDPGAIAMEALVASIMLHAIRKGDPQRSEWVLNRAGLRIKDDPTAAIQLLLSSMPKEDLLRLNKKAAELLSGGGEVQQAKKDDPFAAIEV